MNYTELTTKQRKNVRCIIDGDYHLLIPESLCAAKKRLLEIIFGVGRQDAYYGMLSAFRKDQTKLYGCEIRDGELFLDSHEVICCDIDFIALLNVIKEYPLRPAEVKIGGVTYKEDRDEAEKYKLLEIAFVQTIFDIWQDLQNKREDKRKNNVS